MGPGWLKEKEEGWEEEALFYSCWCERNEPVALFYCIHGLRYGEKKRQPILDPFFATLRFLTDGHG